MNLNTVHLPTYKALSPVLRSQTTSFFTVGDQTWTMEIKKGS